MLKPSKHTLRHFMTIFAQFFRRWKLYGPFFAFFSFPSQSWYRFDENCKESTEAFGSFCRLCSRILKCSFSCLNNGKRRDRLKYPLTILDRFSALTPSRICPKSRTISTAMPPNWSLEFHYILKRSISCCHIVAMGHDKPTQLYMFVLL